MNVFGKLCVNCTAAAIALISIITVATLVWVSLL